MAYDLPLKRAVSVPTLLALLKMATDAKVSGESIHFRDLVDLNAKWGTPYVQGK